MPGKRVRFDQAPWNALDLLARDSVRDFEELRRGPFRAFEETSLPDNAEGRVAGERAEGAGNHPSPRKGRR
jgi:hypothetical protein